MKKYLAFLLCLLMIISLCSCVVENGDNNENTTDTTDDTTDITTESVEEEISSEEEPSPSPSLDAEKNKSARQAYGAVLRNETVMYYPLRDSSKLKEMYFESMGLSDTKPSRQAMVDMDKDGINELILVYTSTIVVLHYENGLVYGFDTGLDSMETIYTDGSFSWSSYYGMLGHEYGISRLSFVNGKPKYEELCRREGTYNYYVNGIEVTREQYEKYAEENVRTPIEFAPFNTAFLDPKAANAVKIAEEYWGIKDGEFDAETGYRYRVLYTGTAKKDGRTYYMVNLHCFVNNDYYDYLSVAAVDIHAKEVYTSVFADGKG